MSVTSKKADIVLEQILCINYLFCFQKNIINIRDLIDLGTEVNLITPKYAAKLCF